MSTNPDQHNDDGTYDENQPEQQSEPGHYVDETPSGEIASRYANFATEEPINPREQRLRAAPAPAAEEYEVATAAYDEVSDQPEQPQYDDPWGVGQDKLAANNIPATASPAAEGEAEASSYNPSALERRREQFGSASTALYPAEWGWRGWCNRTIGTKLSPPNPGPEVDNRLNIEEIQLRMPGVPVIVVADPKGGENKTGTVLELSATIGSQTGVGVVAWDASSSFGSMAMRAHIGRSDDRSVWTLLPQARTLLSPGTVKTAVDEHLIRQPTRFDVLPSDDSGMQRNQLDWSACEAILAVLKEKRDVIIVDTDNNHLAESLRWALVRADQIVIPMTARDDTMQEVETMLRLAKGDPQIGETKVAQSIVLLSPLPDAPVTAERRELIEMMLEQFGITTILDMPYEPAFAGHRGRIVHEDLLPATRNKYVELAALITSRLRTRAMTSAVNLSTPPPPESYTGQWAAPRPPAPVPPTGYAAAPTGYGTAAVPGAGDPLAHLARPATREPYPPQGGPAPTWHQPTNGGYGQTVPHPASQQQFTGYQVDNSAGMDFGSASGLHRAR